MRIKFIEESRHRRCQYVVDVKNKTSKFKGVCIRKDRKSSPWTTKVKYKTKDFHLGSYSSELKAAAAYDVFANMFLRNPQLNSEFDVQIIPELLTNQELEELNTKLEKIKIWVRSKS